MNNFTIGFKRFITNKNVVTIILVLVILVALYIGYSSSIKQQTNPVSLPVASHTINPQTQITNADVKYVQVANSMVSSNAIRYSGAIIGKYTNINVTIPEGSLFYAEWLVDQPKGTWIENLNREEGELGYYMDVNIESTLGNSVLPNTYIDIYMRTTDENGTIMFGKLMKNIKVLVVHDSSGNDIFADSSNIGYPSKIGFAVSQDYYTLLKKAEYLSVDLIIAPRGSNVPTEDYAVVTSATLRDFIDAQTITVMEDETSEEVDDSVRVVPEQEENEVIE